MSCPAKLSRLLSASWFAWGSVIVNICTCWFSVGLRFCWKQNCLWRCPPQFLNRQYPSLGQEKLSNVRWRGWDSSQKALFFEWSIIAVEQTGHQLVKEGCKSLISDYFCTSLHLLCLAVLWLIYNVISTAMLCTVHGSVCLLIYNRWGMENGCNFSRAEPNELRNLKWQHQSLFVVCRFIL